MKGSFVTVFSVFFIAGCLSFMSWGCASLVIAAIDDAVGESDD